MHQHQVLLESRTYPTRNRIPTSHPGSGRAHRRRALLGLLIVAAGAAGCGSPASGTRVGAAEGSDLLLGVVSDGMSLRAYACDGESIAEWFRAENFNGEPIVSTSGAAVLTVPRGGATAELDLGTDRVFTIQTSAVEGTRTGIFRAERNTNGTTFVGGWVVLPDGTQRGAVQGGPVTLFGAVLDLSTLTAEVPGVGTLQAAQLSP